MIKGVAQDIESLAVKNDKFRRVLYTAKHCQLVLMALKLEVEDACGGIPASAGDADCDDGGGRLPTLTKPDYSAQIPEGVPSQHASCIGGIMPNSQPTRWLAQVPDQPNDLPTPETDEPTTGDDEGPATPPTEPEPVPIEDPRPDTQPPGPYVV